MITKRPALALLLLAIGPGPGCGKGPSDLPDLVLVTVDTLRGDAWGCLGDPGARTPVVDRLARGGTVAFEGRAPVPVTLPSHASMLTGLPPVVHGVRDNGIFRLPADEGRTVTEELRDAGYATGAFVSAYPVTGPFGLDRGFDRYDSHVGGRQDLLGSVAQRRAGRTVERCLRWVRGERGDPPPADAPLFLWIHFYDPHADYEPPDGFALAFPDAPYHGEVAYTDRMLGKLLGALDRERDRPRNVLVTSDHGEGLGEHGESTHGVLLHLSTIRVPIAWRGARYAPRLLPEPVPVETVAATLLEAAKLPGELNAGAARSLLEPPGAVLAETLYPHFSFGWRGLRSWEEDGWRLVTGANDRLYRPAEDPGERQDLAARHPDVVARLKEALEEEWERRRAAAFRSGTHALSNGDLEKLTSLGYATGEAAAGDDPEEGFRRGDDPAGRIGLVDRINLGTTLLRQERREEAAAVLGAIVLEDPGNRHALQHLGRALAELGRLEDARAAYRSALELGPGSLALYLELADVERALGRYDEEYDVLVDALARNPASVSARNRIARILVDRGRAEEAIEVLEEAIRRRPRSTEAHQNLATVYEMLGRREEAVRHLRRIVELEPNGPLGQRARESLRAAGVDPSS